MGTLTNKPPKNLKSVDNKLVSERDTTLPSEIRFLHMVGGVVNSTRQMFFTRIRW